MFPNGGAYPINRGNYMEIMWGVGFCWGINRLAMKDTGLFDEAIGHQNEPDWCMRLRMAGWRCAALPGVQVRHDAAATNDPLTDRAHQSRGRRIRQQVEPLFQREGTSTTTLRT